jgi:hypothetical protein
VILKFLKSKYTRYASCLTVLVLFFTFALVGSAFGIVMLDKNIRGDTGDTATGGGDAGIRESSCVQAKYPKITDEPAFAKAIDSYINSIAPKSPLNNLGTYFVSGGKKSGVSPAYIVALAQKESTFGQKGIATNGSHNSFGRKAGRTQPSVEGWYAWPTWEDSLSTTKNGYEDIAAYIKRGYMEGEITGKKLDTIELIKTVYCPDSGPDRCADTNYVSNVKSTIDKINKIAGGAVTCE